MRSPRAKSASARTSSRGGEVLAVARLDELEFDGSIFRLRRQESRPRTRFDGIYGRLYNRVVQNSALRRALFSLWGSADPLLALDRFVVDAVRAATAMSPSAVIVDLPSGGGTVLSFVAREGFSGTIVSVDLADVMLRRAVAAHSRTARGLQTVYVQSDAMNLHLSDAVADVVISINGLHVVSDPTAFLREVARVTKPGGKLWIITPVDGPGLRSAVILEMARLARITPKKPPSVAALHQLLAAAGFRRLHDYGGRCITGGAYERL